MMWTQLDVSASLLFKTKMAGKIINTRQAGVNRSVDQNNTGDRTEKHGPKQESTLVKLVILMLMHSKTSV